MSITIPDEIIEATHMTEKELLQEMAILLFQKEKITLSQASKLAKMSLIQFQHLLASKEIPIHYEIEDFEEDLKTLKNMGRM